MKERNLCITPIDRELTETGSTAVYMGVTMKIRRSNNPEYVKALSVALKDARGGLTVLAKEETDTLVAEAMAGTVLIGWTWKRDGEEIPFTIENAKNLLRNDFDARDFISNHSMNIENFLTEEHRAIKKK